MDKSGRLFCPPSPPSPLSPQCPQSILTNSVNIKDYIKKLRKHEPELDTYWGTNCPLVEMVAADGEIINLLRNQELYGVLLFGSYAYGKAHDESDLDLLVIFDKEGISSNYKEILQNKKTVSAA